jgi:ferric-dicitrate binding protein FerR (iron transport regulator)
MKRKKLEKWLLLEASGELSPRQLRRLDRELAVSEDARALRQELGRLKGSIFLPEIEPSPWTVTRIAARLREDRRSVLTVTQALRPILALAACLTLVVGILNFHGKQNSSSLATVVAAAGVDVWNDPLEEDLSRLERQIMAISGDSLDTLEM